MVALPIEPATARAVRKQALLGPEWLTAVRHTPVEKANPDGWYQYALTADGPVPGPNVLQLAETNLSPRERSEVKAFTRHTLERTDPHLHPFALPADRYTSVAPTVALAEEVAVYLSCQGDAAWPSGTIDLCGAPW